ncbi:phospholipid-binding protein MlaC [Hyphomonas sp.]|uniref:MlaC/ttg2D family ABC transporter substrate-binding protein n=1 Tax=Hyphomonas sp. TaxID=87 RepID=UPI00391C8B85
MTRIFIPILLALGFMAVSLPAHASKSAEAYVEQNANEVLATLNSPSLSAEERTRKFSEYMDQFADFNAISNFVIGKYARRFTADELARYRRVFRTYALAVYENQLDAYRGEAVVVQGSVDRSPTESIVNTTIRRRDGRDMNVRWRVQANGDRYQVIDVALNIEGSLIWLAIEQRAQFIALLDRTNGSADELIGLIERMTADLRNPPPARR